MEDRIFPTVPCPVCGGRGFRQNPRHFFYGVALVASGVLTYMHWPPVPTLFHRIESLFEDLGAPAWLGTAVLWVVCAVPSVFGIAFLFVWLQSDTCSACQGRRRVDQPGADDAAFPADGNPPEEASLPKAAVAGGPASPEHPSPADPASSAHPPVGKGASTANLPTA